LIRNLVNGTLDPGTYKPLWDGKDSRGNQAASGIYIVRILSGDFVDHRKIVLLK
jgi:hypothetical protein